LGALFSSTLFPKRAPESHVLLTVFIGGGRQPDIARKESNELLKIVKGELENLIGLRGDPILREHVYWPRSIPGYHVGYERVLESMLELESKHEGLRFAGNFRNGISVPDCIKNGLKLAEEI
jgi:oxygen-dependent protoporphyrinogen oxidase